MRKFGIVEKSFYKNGYHCIVVFTKNGVYNGYIGIDSSNCMFSKRYSTPLPMLSSKDRKFNGNVLGLLCASIENSDELSPDLYFSAHGGLTFSGYIDDKNDYGTENDKWYFGFDCNHAGDSQDYTKAFKLGLITLEELLVYTKYSSYGEFRNAEYVENCLNKLAEEFYEFENNGKGE